MKETTSRKSTTKSEEELSDKYKQAQETLRESEERFRLLVEGTVDYAMFLLDNERRITHWNSGAERIFGYTREEALGQGGDMIFTPEDRAAGAPVEEARTATRDGRAVDRRWHLRKDGSRFWADGVLTSLHNNKSTPAKSTLYGFAKILRDATKEREAEEELQRAHDELEERVAERTAQLRRSNEARARLLSRLVTAQEEERKRISRELHDQMGQQLTALLMGLKALPDYPDAGASPPPMARRLDDLQRMADGLMEQVNRLAWELRPPALDNLGLETALRGYVEEWAGRTNIQADFVRRGKGGMQRPPAEVEAALYRVLQEALTNVERHADAQSVSVLLERQDNCLTVIIEDDGKGLEAEAHETAPASSSSRLGLLGMHERMALVGGTLTIESASGAGTTVYARAPLKRSDDEPEA